MVGTVVVGFNVVVGVVVVADRSVVVVADFNVVVVSPFNVVTVTSRVRSVEEVAADAVSEIIVNTIRNAIILVVEAIFKTTCVIECIGCRQ